MPDEPQTLGHVVAHQWLCDHFGHLNARHYAAAFDDAIFAFWAGYGATAPAPGKPGVFPVTARLAIDYCAEVLAGTVLRVTGQPVRIGGKSVTLELVLSDAATGVTVARCDVTEVFFDALSRQSAPVPDPIRTALAGALRPGRP